MDSAKYFICIISCNPDINSVRTKLSSSFYHLGNKAHASRHSPVLTPLPVGPEASAWMPPVERNSQPLGTSCSIFDSSGPEKAPLYVKLKILFLSFLSMALCKTEQVQIPPSHASAPNTPSHVFLSKGAKHLRFSFFSNDFWMLLVCSNLLSEVVPWAGP